MSYNASRKNDIKRLILDSMKKKAKSKTVKKVSKHSKNKNIGKSTGAIGAKKENMKNDSKIMPLGDRIILKPFTEEETTTTASGIIIPDTVSKEKPEQGRVVAVGEGKMTEGGKRIPLSVKVGDKVVFSRYGYDEIKIGGEEYYVLKEENILAVINN